MATYVVKERSQYLQKASITGAERIVVSGSEYITPDQILERAGIKAGGLIVYVDTVQALKNKTYEGYTLGDACSRGVATSSSSNTTTLVPLSLLKSYAQKQITTSSKLPASLVSGLATVATSGKFTDLVDAPTIPKVSAIDDNSFEIDGQTYNISSVGGDYLPISGGQLTGDLWLKNPSSDFGSTIYFGNKASNGTGYVYITEESNNILTIYSSAGIRFKTISTATLTFNGDKIVTVANKATASAYGVVKVGASRNSAITATTGSAVANRFYGVEMDINGKLFVNVPWSGGEGSSMSSLEIFQKIGSDEPHLERKRGYFNNVYQDYIHADHRAFRWLSSGSKQFVLMVSAKKNSRSKNSKPMQDGNVRTKKGWCVAMGQYANTEFAQENVELNINDLREYILHKYVFVEGYTKSQVQEMSYDTFSKLSPSLRKGFGTNVLSIKSVKTFGIALRCKNPEFESLMTSGHTHGIHCQDIQSVPRYLYSSVAKMYVHINRRECSINFGFIR